MLECFKSLPGSPSEGFAAMLPYSPSCTKLDRPRGQETFLGGHPGRRVSGLVDGQKVVGRKRVCGSSGLSEATRLPFPDRLLFPLPKPARVIISY